MKNLSVRAAEPGDSKTYAEWLTAAKDINLVDPAVYSYPTCNTMVIEKAGDPTLMTSFHATIMVEALAPKPGLSPMDEARSLKVLFDTLEGVAKASGVKEIWFGCSDPRVQEFGKRHGIEEVPFKVYRKKL